MMKKTMYAMVQNRSFSIALFVALTIAAFLPGCSREKTGGEPAATESAAPAENEPAAAESAASAEGEPAAGDSAASSEDESGVVKIPDFSLVSGEGFNVSPKSVQVDYKPVSVEPSVMPYTVEPGLANVEKWLWPWATQEEIEAPKFSWLSDAEKTLIVQNGFVVRPCRDSSGKKPYEQLFYVYESGSYTEGAVFVTADSVLQLYHLFFDSALRNVERDNLLNDALVLNQSMMRALTLMLDGISEPEIKRQALLCLGYFGVAQLAFGGELPRDFPPDLSRKAMAEYDLIKACGGPTVSPLFGDELWTNLDHNLDYSMFKPRGHYTSDEKLQRYFRGMMWYGLVPNQLIKSGTGQRLNGPALRTILTCIALSKIPAKYGVERWENIYWTSAFFAGNSDDGGPIEYSKIVNSVYGPSPDLNKLADKLDSFYGAALKLPTPKIIAGYRDAEQERQFRFMGQRYVPDAEITQRLTEAKPIETPQKTFITPREFPKGLDVFAVLGSDRAAELTVKFENPAKKWPEYNKRYEDLRKEFSALPVSTWQSNMYYGLLWSQQALLGSYGEGYPFFMTNKAWEDKSLATALSGWTELKHDTVLYSKQSTAEWGGDGPDVYPNSYVEPQPELYNRLLWLVRFARENLSARDILPENVKLDADALESVAQTLLDDSLTELSGEELSVGAESWLYSFGGRMFHISLDILSRHGKDFFSWSEIKSPDKDMALIADIASGVVQPADDGGTADRYYLEEAVGHANEIFVVIPAKGKLWLAKGAVFDYYEFLSPERLSDEEWQATLNQGKAPPRPAWVSSYFTTK